MPVVLERREAGEVSRGELHHSKSTNGVRPWELMTHSRLANLLRLVSGGAEEAGMKDGADARRHWMFFWFLVSFQSQLTNPSH